jgi:hypothetical protein
MSGKKVLRDRGSEEMEQGIEFDHSLYVQGLTNKNICAIHRA